MWGFRGPLQLICSVLLYILTAPVATDHKGLSGRRWVPISQVTSPGAGLWPDYPINCNKIACGVGLFRFVDTRKKYFKVGISIVECGLLYGCPSFTELAPVSILHKHETDYQLLINLDKSVCSPWLLSNSEFSMQQWSSKGCRTKKLW